MHLGVHILGGVMLNRVLTFDARKLFFFLSINLFLVLTTAAQAETLKDGIKANKYAPRTKPIINFALVYYGDFWTEKDLARVGDKFEEKFKKSTNGMILANVAYKKVIRFKDISKKMKNFSLKHIKDPIRLRRLWYPENKKGSWDIAKEIYDEIKKSDLKNDLDKIDAVLAVTAAQFEGLGVAVGRMLLTEQPREVAWGMDYQRVDILSDAEVVDELLHEAGHFIGFGHAAYKCSMRYQKTLGDVKTCCETSPNALDVMSYCRKRADVTDQFFYKYEVCHLNIIKTQVLPRLLGGSKIRSSNPSLCE
jgi:hypothetical protein